MYTFDVSVDDAEAMHVLQATSYFQQLGTR